MPVHHITTLNLPFDSPDLMKLAPETVHHLLTGSKDAAQRAYDTLTGNPDRPPTTFTALLVRIEEEDNSTTVNLTLAPPDLDSPNWELRGSDVNVRLEVIADSSTDDLVARGCQSAAPLYVSFVVSEDGKASTVETVAGSFGVTLTLKSVRDLEVMLWEPKAPAIKLRHVDTPGPRLRTFAEIEQQTDGQEAGIDDVDPVEFATQVASASDAEDWIQQRSDTSEIELGYIQKRGIDGRFHQAADPQPAHRSATSSSSSYASGSASRSTDTQPSSPPPSSAGVGGSSSPLRGAVKPRGPLHPATVRASQASSVGPERRAPARNRLTPYHRPAPGRPQQHQRVDRTGYYQTKDGQEYASATLADLSSADSIPVKDFRAALGAPGWSNILAKVDRIDLKTHNANKGAYVEDTYWLADAHRPVPMYVKIQNPGPEDLDRAIDASDLASNTAVFFGNVKTQDGKLKCSHESGQLDAHAVLLRLSEDRRSLESPPAFLRAMPRLMEYIVMNWNTLLA